MNHLIALDWGTSSFRAYLLDAAGVIEETRHKPWGIRQLPEGGFGGAFAAMVAGWPDCPVIAAGMVGSRNGWQEAPYLDIPAGVAALAAALVPVPAPGGRVVHVVAGPAQQPRPRRDARRGDPAGRRPGAAAAAPGRGDRGAAGNAQQMGAGEGRRDHRFRDHHDRRTVRTAVPPFDPGGGGQARCTHGRRRLQPRRAHRTRQWRRRRRVDGCSRRGR